MTSHRSTSQLGDTELYGRLGRPRPPTTTRFREREHPSTHRPRHPALGEEDGIDATLDAAHRNRAFRLTVYHEHPLRMVCRPATAQC